jgi:hypothetical protein
VIKISLSMASPPQHDLMEQPPRVSGVSMGRTPLSVVAPAAWCAGILDAAAFPEFGPIGHALQKFCIPIHAMVLDALGGVETITSNDALAERFPVTPDGLTDPAFASHLLLNYNKTRVQGVITNAIMTRRLAKLDARNSIAEFDARPRKDLTDNDAAAYHSLRQRSRAGLTLNYIFSEPKMLMAGRYFVPYMRYMLLLPQLNRGFDNRNLLDEATGCSVSKCMRCANDIPLDMFANHAMTCKAAKEHCVERHDDIRDALYAFTRTHMPDARTKHEPSAPFLMMDNYPSSRRHSSFATLSTSATSQPLSTGLSVPRTHP